MAVAFLNPHILVDNLLISNHLLPSAVDRHSAFGASR
jgi:hypothetical protein